MTATLAAYAKGHQLPPLQLNLSDPWVRSYVEAVEDSTIEHHPGSVPPMALAALVIGALLKSAGLPPGAVHVAQELSFVRSVSVGQALTATARVLSRREHQGWILMGIELTVADDSGNSVMDGRATLTFPVAAEA